MPTKEELQELIAMWRETQRLFILNHKTNGEPRDLRAAGYYGECAEDLETLMNGDKSVIEKI